MAKHAILSLFPDMNSLLAHPLFDRRGREAVKRAARDVLGELRAGVLSGDIGQPPDLDECARQVLARLEAGDVPFLRRVINATGVILHTNLGRAPLGAALGGTVAALGGGYCNLEYDLDTGRRGDRCVYAERPLCVLTGAEAAMVVNNNAAAVFLMLSALARGKRVAVSRGELVEIGGSFRIPEIMEQSGAELVEVGSTNKTRLSDYAAAVEKKGAELLLKVHTSNYRIVGFTESVSLGALSAFGKKMGLPVLCDMGACFMAEPGELGLAAGYGESARSGIAAGADLICFSGDKLFGAAQAGILAGRGDLVAGMKKHPAARMLRPDKLTLAALEAALRVYGNPGEAKRRIPAIAMLAADPGELRGRAEALAERLRAAFPDWSVTLRKTADKPGGGALPDVSLPGWALAILPAAFSPAELERRLRRGRVPVILRLRDGAALLSVRTLLPGEEDEILDAFAEAAAAGAS